MRVYGRYWCNILPGGFKRCITISTTYRIKVYYIHICTYVKYARLNDYNAPSPRVDLCRNLLYRSCFPYTDLYLTNVTSAPVPIRTVKAGKDEEEIGSLLCA